MNQKSILLVDDDSDLLQVIGNRCRSIGLCVEQARNLLTATSLIEKHLPDIVCVDVNMPTGNGLCFCEALAADPKTSGIPIIVLTGQRDADTLAVCRRLELHYVPKKADAWSTLQPLITKLLAQPPTERPPLPTGIRPRKLPPRLIPPLPADDEVRLPPTGKAQRQVVVADDDADLVRLLTLRFSTLGCAVIGVDTALEAINAIHRVMPDLVVLDVNMPSGSGLSVCEMMATDEQLRMIPVIVLTGQSDENTIRRCHDLLVFYVQKGVNIWCRIEPLVRELLHLGDAPAVAADGALAESADAMPTSDAQAEVVPPGTQSDALSVKGDGMKTSGRDTLLDAVFAMLGSETVTTPTDATADPTAIHDQVARDVPWVLSIDDDADFSDALRIRLEEHGVAVARAFSGMEGYRLAFSSPASAILLDFKMPNGQGDYILDRLKSNPVTKDIPVFVLTGVKDKVLQRRMLAMGAAGFLNKPVNFDQLRDELAEHINILAAPARGRPAIASTSL